MYIFETENPRNCVPKLSSLVAFRECPRGIFIFSFLAGWLS